MHTRTCSHLLLLTYVSRNTHTHISAACGWHPQCCKTSYIPHAYITPFPPPPADHSSFYPAFALSHSLLLSLKSVWLAPSAHKQNSCYSQFMKGHVPAVRSGGNLKTWLRNLHNLWQLRGSLWAAPSSLFMFVAVFNTHTTHTHTRGLSGGK